MAAIAGRLSPDFVIPAGAGIQGIQGESPVIEISPRGSVFRTARKQLKAAEAGNRFGAD